MQRSATPPRESRRSPPRTPTVEERAERKRIREASLKQLAGPETTVNTVVGVQRWRRKTIAGRTASGEPVPPRAASDGRDGVIAAEVAKHAAEMSADAQEELRRDLVLAREHFDELDADKNGVLNGEELNNLATWVLTSFQPGGKVLPKASRAAEAKKLLQRLDANGDGELDFEEFAEWFGRTSASIVKFREAQASRATRGVSPGRDSPRTRSSTPPRAGSGSSGGDKQSGTPPRARRSSAFDRTKSKGGVWTNVQTKKKKKKKEASPAKQKALAVGLAQMQAKRAKEEEAAEAEAAEREEEEMLRQATEQVEREEREAIAAAVTAAGLAAVEMVRRAEEAAAWTAAVANAGPPVDPRVDPGDGRQVDVSTAALDAAAAAAPQPHIGRPAGGERAKKKAAKKKQKKGGGWGGCCGQRPG